MLYHVAQDARYSVFISGHGFHTGTLLAVATDEKAV
jgi:hypothetical protein